MEELNARFAVRFFLKKSKRFDLLKQQMQHRLQELTGKKPEQEKEKERRRSSPECLLYLGLAPSRKSREREERPERREEEAPDFDFPKPTIYECAYCVKIFYNKLVYRRHMISHMKKGHRCSKCNRGFVSRILRRRHELSCCPRWIIQGRGLRTVWSLLYSREISLYREVVVKSACIVELRGVELLRSC